MPSYSRYEGVRANIATAFRVLHTLVQRGPVTTDAQATIRAALCAQVVCLLEGSDMARREGHGMRAYLTGLATLHGATLLALGWVYGTADSTHGTDQQLLGAFLIILAGTLVWMGAPFVSSTPMIAAVLFGLAGALPFGAPMDGHAYVPWYGAWALVLAGMAVALIRVQDRAPAWRPTPQLPVAQAIVHLRRPMAGPAIAGHYLHQVARYRAAAPERSLAVRRRRHPADERDDRVLTAELPIPTAYAPATEGTPNRAHIARPELAGESSEA
jgi:hypothetical protein